MYLNKIGEFISKILKRKEKIELLEESKIVLSQEKNDFRSYLKRTYYYHEYSNGDGYGIKPILNIKNMS